MTSKSRFLKVGFPILLVLIATSLTFMFNDDGGCSATQLFSIDYKTFDTAEYQGTDQYLKEGVSLQDFVLNRGNCENPNTFTWHNLTNHDVEFQSDFSEQQKTLKPGETYSYTFNNRGTFSYSIGTTKSTITIN